MAVLVVLGLAGPAAGPAAARHENGCPDYTTTSHYTAIDDAVVEGIALVAEFVHNMLDDFNQAEAQIGSAIAVGVTTAVQLAVQGVNSIAQECRDGGHWVVEDQLMIMQIQANLAVTTTADAMFVFPGSAAANDDPPGFNAPPGGFIDGESEDTDPEAMVGVKTTVRFTIDKMKALSQCTCTSADAYYNKAVTELGNGAYKSAYKYFRQAYVLAFSN